MIEALDSRVLAEQQAGAWSITHPVDLEFAAALTARSSAGSHIYP